MGHLPKKLYVQPQEGTDLRKHCSCPNESLKQKVSKIAYTPKFFETFGCILNFLSFKPKNVLKIKCSYLNNFVRIFVQFPQKLGDSELKNHDTQDCRQLFCRKLCIVKLVKTTELQFFFKNSISNDERNCFLGNFSHLCPNRQPDKITQI